MRSHTIRHLSIRILAVITITTLIFQIDAVSASRSNVTRLQIVMQTDYVMDRLSLGEWDRIGTLPDTDRQEQGPEHLYNYATMLTQQWEEVGVPDALEPRQEAVKLYDELLETQVNEYAVHNVAVLRRLLEDNGVEMPQESEESGEQSEEGESEEGEEQEGEEWEETGSEEWEGEEEGQSWEEGEDGEGEEWSEGDSQQPSESGLSEEQIQQIQEYQEQLEQQQFQNQQHYGKPWDSEQQGVFDQLFGQQQLQDQRGGVEKDW